MNASFNKDCNTADSCRYAHKRLSAQVLCLFMYKPDVGPFGNSSRQKAFRRQYPFIQANKNFKNGATTKSAET